MKARFGFGLDTGAAVRAYLAVTKWLLGEVEPTPALIEEAVACAIETGQVPTLVHTYFYKAHFETVRTDAGAARRDAEIVVELSQENALTHFTARGTLQSAWVSARLVDRETGVTSFDKCWRRTPTKETKSSCRSTKVWLPRSKLKATRREP